MNTAETLSTDDLIFLLNDELAKRDTELAKREEKIVQLGRDVTDKDQKIQTLEEQLAWFKRQIFGKAVVATNAIKHGIFTKDLILLSESEKESIEDYEELLYRLIDSLGPCNQMESLLVEKIAVDFWRLRRTIRFETGSIAKCIKTLLEEFYS